MYVSLNLKLRLDEFESSSSLIRIGKSRKKALLKDSEAELMKFTMSNGTIDGTSLSDSWFTAVRSDIFISHSHNDEDLAFALAGWLKKTFDLNVFLDEVVWGNADGLLRILDDKYCMQENGSYSYKKRNLTTSHIHAMLSTAIFSVMDKTEVVIFLNTNESIPKIGAVIGEDSTYTLSPWLYEELVATKLLRVTNWSEYRKNVILEFTEKRYGERDLRIAYKVPIAELKTIDIGNLKSWETKYKDRRNEPYGGLLSQIPDHPLNYLYEITFKKQNPAN